MADSAQTSVGQKRKRESIITQDEGISRSSIEELKNAMYAACASLPENKTFDQAELLDLGTVPDRDIHLLQKCTTQLTKEGLFKLMTKNNRVCWRVVKRANAARYKSLTPDEALVFSYVESAGQEGIWTKAIKLRAGLHVSVVTKCIKTLETGKYIKQIKTIRFPNRKTYMLYDLNVSENVTGGPFYDKENAEIDVDFVQVMAEWAERYIIGRSWYHTSIPHSVNRNTKDPRAKVSRDRSNNMLPMPPGYTGYPTIAEITRDLNKSGLSNTLMKEAEMQQLIDILCWDGRIEKAWSGQGYRAVRQLDRSESDIGLAESPCGRCPNLDICHDDGPVNTKSCVYFPDWLAAPGI